MQNKDSNWVYVVSLSDAIQPGWSISWIDIVKVKGLYFHQATNNWPKEPPNYIAFRYNGKLQSIHHIDSYKVVNDLHSEIPEIPVGESEPRFLYKLGPAFTPNKVIKVGSKIRMNARVWCMLDTLFTCNDLTEARDLSKQRTL